MKFTLSSTVLSGRLSNMAKVINSKNSLAILNCFLFEVKDQTLTVVASDSENVMQTTIPLNEADQDGRFCVESHTILDSVKELSEQPLSFEIDMDTLNVTLTYQNGHFNFVAQSADQYPKAQGVGDVCSEITLDAMVLSENINRSIFATAQDELRPVMNGIYFDLTPDSLVIVATDGHKLVKSRNFTVKSEQPASFILPKKPATLLRSTLTKDTGNVTITFDDRNAKITFGDSLLQCRLIEGRFPNYNSVIPTGNPNKLTVDRATLLSAMRRVLVSASQSSSLVRFHVEQGLLMLKADDADFSRSAEERIVCDYQGTTMDIGFKGTAVVEILNNLGSQDVDVELADPSRPGVIIPTQQEENEEVVMLIMPMLLND